jgi:hypothetical protein
MFKYIISIAIFLLVIAVPVLADDATNMVDAKNLIDQKIECSKLSTDQLDKIGDYYMEAMAPGQGHESMESIMGGEGSDSLKQAHIFMARRWYCGDAVGLGMMGMMTGSYGPGVMNWEGNQSGVYNGRGSMMGFNPNRGYNMMFGYGGGWMFIIYVLSVVFLIVGITASVKYVMNKK